MGELAVSAEASTVYAASSPTTTFVAAPAVSPALAVFAVAIAVIQSYCLVLYFLCFFLFLILYLYTLCLHRILHLCGFNVFTDYQVCSTPGRFRITRSLTLYIHYYLSAITVYSISPAV